MLRKFLCVAALAMFAVPAQAGVLSSLLTFNGTTDALQASTSRVNVVDTDGSLDISSGDVVYGFIEFNQVLQDGGFNQAVTPATLAAVFSVEVGAGTPLGPTTVYDLVAASGASSVASLTGLAGIGATDPFAIVSTSATVNTAGPAYAETTTTARTFAEGFTAAAGTPDGLTAFSGWDLELTASLTGADDFFLFQDFGGFGFQTGGATVTSKPGLSPGVVFLPVPTVLPPGGAPSGLSSEIALGLTAVTASSINGWGFSGNSSFKINAVPEPATLLAFAGIAVVGLVARRRRKNA